ncbi:MAG: acyl-CoA dehydrogenase family protein [Methylocystis sp.]
MNYATSADQKSIAQSARAFSEKWLDPIAESLDHNGAFPRAIVEELAAQNFLGLLLPKELGGAEACFVSHVEVVLALSRSCPAVASILNNHALAAFAIAEWGNDDQKKRYLPALAKGKQLGAIAIYESGAALGIGHDALLASRTDRKFTLNGAKAFVRNAGAADIYVVFATLEPPALTAFIVDSTAPGLAIGPPLETMGLRGCPVAHLVFDNVPITQDAILGAENGGGPIVTRLLALGSVAEAAQTVAIGHAAIAHAAEFARYRVQFRHPVADFQAIQALLAEVTTDSHLAWQGVQRTAQLIDEKAPFETEAAMVKVFLGRFGAKMLIDACQVEGGLGISEVAPAHIHKFMSLARMFRDIVGTTLLDAPGDFPDELIAESLSLKH